jgi:uncharacterized membrane protein YgaE (UPF0421/DUF939 family)
MKNTAIQLTTRAKEAIKTALAMVIAYSIALQMGWGEPMWAGFAVIFISLGTLGQSLNKATLRMVGTLLAAFMALMLISLFAEERWLFMLFLSFWAGFCTYMMGGSKNQYFWHVSCFACVIICMDGGLNPVNAFDTAMLRTQETAMGILVYSIVAIFLWPINARSNFDVAAAKLASMQQQLFRSYMDLMKGQNKPPNDSKDKSINSPQQSQALLGQVLQVQNQFEQLLGPAATDSYEIWELRRQWQQYRSQVLELSEVMERWHESFVEIKHLDMQELLPNLTEFNNEIEQRFCQIGHMLAGDAPTVTPKSISLLADIKSLNQLSNFHKAALAVIRGRLQRVEQLTQSIFDCIGDIRGFQPPIDIDTMTPAAPVGFVIDMDRVTAVIRVMVGMWLAFLALIYVNDLPGGAGLVSMVVPINMALATSPQLPVGKLIVPIFGSMLLASLLYIFVMPMLSSFMGLGALIFVVTFSFCYLFYKPQQVLIKLFGVVLFLSIASISNEQSYSFLVVSSTALMFSVLFILLVVTAYIPFSPHPEKAYLRLLGRFFRSSEYLVSTLQQGAKKQSKWPARWRMNFHIHELTTLPKKLTAWSRVINTKTLSGTTTEDVQKLTSTLQTLTYRLQELHEAHGYSQSEFLVGELKADILSWQLKVKTALQRLADDPAGGELEQFQNKLSVLVEHMETRIQETLDKVTDDRLSNQDSENFYRLLGAYRGVSEALVNYAGNAGVMDWSQWREERF